MTLRKTLGQIWNNIQYKLFPDLEERIGELSEQHKKIISALELLRVEEFIPCTRFNFGRPLKNQSQIARAFIAKIILKISHTKELIRILQTDKQLKIICGWDSLDKVPSESKFSRAFKKFTETGLPEKIHKAIIAEFYENQIIGHIVKDSTAIGAREPALKKENFGKERKKLLNRQQAKERKNGTSRKQRQLKQNLDLMIQELPVACDIGVKKGSNGTNTIWKGYKLHLAVADHCVPISAILTSASLNDSEVAIPLAEKANLTTKNFYDLMDSAYSSPEVIEHSHSLGHVPIIDKRARNPVQKREKMAEQKRKKLLNAFTAEDKRYKERFPKERCNALLKDFYGAKSIWYKGAPKIFCHLMFGVLALTASTLLSMVQ